jgi:hypothetical protein
MLIAIVDSRWEAGRILRQRNFTSDFAQSKEKIAYYRYACEIELDQFLGQKSSSHIPLTMCLCWRNDGNQDLRFGGESVGGGAMLYELLCNALQE